MRGTQAVSPQAVSPATPAADETTVAERVIIFDCDPGWDDAIALILALGSGHASIIAITTVFGNAPVVETTRNARRITAACRRPDLAVYAGCDRSLSGSDALLPNFLATSAVLAALPARGKAGSRHAADLMIDAARRYGHRLTIVATAPLSNLATAMMRDPTAMGGMGHLIVMGGTLGPGNITEHAEFNLFADPQAAKMILTAAIPKVVIPSEVCDLLPADQDFVSRIRATPGPLSTIVGDLVAERLSLNSGEPVSVYDALAALFLIDAGIFELRSGTIDVEARDTLRLGKLYFAPGTQDAHSKLAVAVDREAAYSMIYDILKRA
jgi:inosine-uridine nucleoside N-ribohydrolase